MLPTQYASFFKRFIAHIVDVVIASMLAIMIVIPLLLLMTGTGILAGISLHGLFDFFGHLDHQFRDPGEFFEFLAAGLPIATIIFLSLIHI